MNNTFNVMKKNCNFGECDLSDNPIWSNHVDYLVKSVLLKSIKLRFQKSGNLKF